MRSLAFFLTFVMSIAAGGTASSASGQDGSVEKTDSVLSRLTGWWVSLGPLSAGFAAAGITIPSVEVLVVTPDGTFEDRFFRFTQPSRGLCAETRWCSDMPLAWRAKLSPGDDSIQLTERAAGEDVIDRPELDGIMRGAAVGALLTWDYRLDTDGRRLLLGPESPGAARVFAKIDPQRLQRLVAAFGISDESGRRWPCFFGNAQAGDPAFATLEGDASNRPGWFDAFIEVAAFQTSLTAVVTNDASRERQEPATLPQPLEQRLVESFEGLVAPRDAAERKSLRDRLVTFHHAVTGAAAPEAAEEAVAPAVAASHIRTFATVMADKGGASWRRLFCSDRPGR